jgi:hypothetical protein
LIRRPDSVSVDLNLHFAKLTGTWTPNEAEKNAAWELYTELITRIAVVPLEGGILREALRSLHSVFSATREILRKYGPDLAEPKRSGEFNFAYLAIAMLNFTLRPILSRWHPLLEDWEAQRAIGVSRIQHEDAWVDAPALRAELESLTAEMKGFVEILAEACGVPNLLAAVPPRKSGT